MQEKVDHDGNLRRLRRMKYPSADTDRRSAISFLFYGCWELQTLKFKAGRFSDMWWSVQTRTCPCPESSAREGFANTFTMLPA